MLPRLIQRDPGDETDAHRLIRFDDTRTGSIRLECSCGEWSAIGLDQQSLNDACVAFDRHVEPTPIREYVCGEDFCDECGDCLACYGSDPCFDGGSHRGRRKVA